MADLRSQQNFPETSMRDFYNVLFRHKRKILVFFFSVVAVVTLGTLLASDVYRSESQLMVRLGRESVTLDPTATTGQVVNIGSERENEINSESEILKSRELAEKVVDAVGPQIILEGLEETLAPNASLLETIRYRMKAAVRLPIKAISKLFASNDNTDPADRLKERDKAVQSLMKHLNVETTKKSNIISAGYETNSPQLARDVLQKLISFYLDKHINAHRTTGSYAFFKEQKASLQSSLAQTEENLKNLKNKTGTASIQEQRHILLDRIGSLQRELEQTESAAAASAARVKALKGFLAGLPSTLQKEETTGVAQSATDGMRKHIYELQLKEQELLSTFTENSIPVREIRREIREGQALLAKAEQPKQVTRGINDTYQKIQQELLTEEGNLSSLQAKAGVLRAQLDGGRNELKTLNDTDISLAQLERELETKKANYRKYSDSLEQARIDQALELEKISNISIVGPASYPVKPIRPRKLLNLALGLFLGAFGGLGLAFFSEYQDHSLKKPEDVDNRLDLPVMATLPICLPNQITGGLSFAAAKGAGSAQLHYDSPLGLNGNGNAFHDLLRLCTGGALAAPCVVGLASCHSGEGVSTTAGLLAQKFAQQGGGRVLLVDANTRCPEQHLSFRTKLSPGLVDFTSNGRPNLGCIQSTEIENLDLLSAGEGKPELSAHALKSLAGSLPALKREYSHIIFDLPSLQEQSPAVRMAGLMDGVILVVEAESTRWEVANKAKEDLLQANTKLLGVILNKRRLHIPDWLYRRL